ncbi:hypothetical protein [Sneathiella sp.]|jgi:acyl-coenzyme A thioesterase PaaI-like protein|uniref:hypothetical protein n=1 Tax=Sneathiella sp. TaxID=1964365 RepID=UPI0025DF3E62|nr:hypothetical protein [Sneathiella sp.]|tara:strand:- start:115 stop:267 length:153 start_codon:yes stop_codon:yes gene_type:complete
MKTIENQRIAIIFPVAPGSCGKRLPGIFCHGAADFAAANLLFSFALEQMS